MSTPGAETFNASPNEEINPQAVAMPPEESESFYSLVADFWISAMKNTRDALNDHIEGLSGAERQKAVQIRDQVDKYLDQLEKQKRKGPMEKFMKIFGPILTAFSILLAVIVPTPMTIAMAAVAVAMFLEPIISKAAGKESLLEQGMGQLMQELSKHLPPAAAAVVTGIIVTVAIMLVTCGLAAGAAAMGAAVGSTGASVATTAASRAAVAGSQAGSAGAGASGGVARSFVQTMAKAMGITPQHTRFEAFVKLMEYLETTLYMAKAGMDIDLAVLNFQLAKALKTYGIEQAYIEELTALIGLIWNDMNNVQQHMERLLDLLTEIFSREYMNFRVA